MTTITLTSSQSQLLTDAAGPVAVYNEAGQQLGYIFLESDSGADADLSPDQAEELVRRMSTSEPRWLTIDELLADSDDRTLG